MLAQNSFNKIFVVNSGALRLDFTSLLVHGLDGSIQKPKCYIAPYDKINYGLVNLSYNCDVKSGLKLEI